MRKYTIVLINLVNGQVCSTNYKFFTKNKALAFARNYRCLALHTAEVVRR